MVINVTLCLATLMCAFLYRFTYMLVVFFFLHLIFVYQNYKSIKSQSIRNKKIICRNVCNQSHRVSASLLVAERKAKPSLHSGASWSPYAMFSYCAVSVLVIIHVKC